MDGTTTIQTDVSIGASVLGAIEKAQITINELDIIDPPSFTLITTPIQIRITRVLEEFEQEELVIPFERQTVRNESLPEGQSLLIQSGENGIQQIIYRRLLENGNESSRTVFRIETISETRPEIVMIGVQSPFTPITIPGKLAYLTAGNAWIMEETTGNRRPVVTTGDLDGRVFSLSSNGNWLLFTRKSTQESTIINSLWVVDLTTEEPVLIDLQVNNIIHYAEFIPDRTATIYYSTVEPRSTAPGWQANNDLHRLVFNASGRIVRDEEIIQPNSGGIYGWWGTNFLWSPDANNLAYARPDSVGIVDLDSKEFIPLIDILPFQTRSDWAWVPGLDWSPDSTLIYTVTHAPMAGLSDPETSPLFDLTVFINNNGPSLRLATQTGMFAYPKVSQTGKFNTSMLGFLEAIFPDQSESSRYRLVIMEQDGSNKLTIFPPEGSAGLDPQQLAWSPTNFGAIEPMLSFIYQGNIWLSTPDEWQSQQITGDGLISRIDWK
jgi:resuscitation-promoting factor RpfB